MATPTTSQLIQQLSHDLARPSETRGWTTRFWKNWSAWFVFYGAAAYLCTIFRPDLAHLPAEIRDPIFWTQTALWLIATVACAQATYRSSFPTDSRLYRAFGIPAVVVGLAILTIFVLSTPDGGVAAYGGFGAEPFHSALAHELDPTRGGCGGFIAILGLTSVLWMGSVIRRAAPTRLMETAAWSALAAGCMGSLFMHLICRFENPIHLMIWHLTPILALTLTSMVSARKLLRW